jgi:hypothetical protein
MYDQRTNDRRRLEKDHFTLLFLTSIMSSQKQMVDPRCVLDVEIPPKYENLSAVCDKCKHPALAEGMVVHAATGTRLCPACTRKSLERVRAMVRVLIFYNVVRVWTRCFFLLTSTSTESIVKAYSFCSVTCAVIWSGGTSCLLYWIATTSVGGAMRDASTKEQHAVE